MTTSAPRVLAFGPLEISLDDGETTIEGRELKLTSHERGLLISLAQKAGSVVLRDELHRNVWGYSGYHGNRVIASYVCRLRSKLERACPEWGFIHTHFGWGYRLDPQPKAGRMTTVARGTAQPWPRLGRPDSEAKSYERRGESDVGWARLSATFRSSPEDNADIEESL